MLLNWRYYQDLWDKYQNIETFTPKFSDKFSILTFKLLVDHCRQKKSIHINIQDSDNVSFIEIGKHLFIEISNDIFCNAADFPQLNIGDKVRSKAPIRVGTPKPRFLDFEIVSIENDKYSLWNKKFSITWRKNFAELVERFIPVARKAQNETLTGFISFYEKLNKRHVHDFTPTYFERKSVFIGSKNFYDLLEVKNKIPTTYFPNPREENTLHETKSIPALPDSIMYFATRYKACYDNILLQGKKIDTVIIFDTEENEIEQIIHDKNRFDFNLIVFTNNVTSTNVGQIPLWNWFKEEIQIINKL